MKPICTIIKKSLGRVLGALLAPSLLLGTLSAFAEPIDFCVYDPQGKNGLLFSSMEDYKLFALQNNIELNMLVRPEEKIAADDFRAGKCHGVMMTGVRGRAFNRFTGTLQAMGATPTVKMYKTIVNFVSQPKMAKYMVSDNGEYEIAGILPMGTVYTFVRDRSVDSVEKMAGKKLAALEYDQAMLKGAQKIGLSIVASNSSNFAQRFNNGSVDIIFAPAVAFGPLELYRGLATNGGILDYPLAQLDFQIIIRRDKFPEGFGQLSRQSTFDRFDDFFNGAKQAQTAIDPKYWVEVSSDRRGKYDDLVREIRISLREEGVYDPNMLKIMRQARCKMVDKTHKECAEKRE